MVVERFLNLKIYIVKYKEGKKSEYANISNINNV